MWIAERLADCADVAAFNLTMNTTSDEQPKGQVDETPLSPIEDVKAPLEKLLGQRPTQKELVDHNILKGPRCPAIPSLCVQYWLTTLQYSAVFASLPCTDPKIAPSLHAAQQELQRRQLEVSKHRNNWSRMWLIIICAIAGQA